MVQSIDLAFKKSDEYQQMAAVIRKEAGNIPEYLLDVCISYHLSHPLAYKQHRGMKFECPEPQKHTVIEDAVKIIIP